MRRLFKHPVCILLLLAAPAVALAAAPPGLAQPVSVAAVILWLAGLGWGFHAMLHRRLAAEDRLAQLEAAVAMERDARQATLQHTRFRMAALEAEWRRLETCLCDGDRSKVPERMHAVQAAIVILQEPA